MAKENEPQIIKTVGENGEEIELKILDIVSVNDMDYALLIAADEDEDDDDDNEIGDIPVFHIIEEIQSINAVAKIISDDGCFCEDDECECHHK